MQFTRWGYGRFAGAGLALGLTIALAIAFSIPPQWRSEGVVTIKASSDREALEIMNRVTQEVMTGPALTGIIQRRSLYRDDRHRIPINDVVLKMRERMQIIPLATPGRFLIGFEYPDRYAAQAAASDLMAELIEQRVRDGGPMAVRGHDGTMRFRSWDGYVRPATVATLPANPSNPPRGAVAMIGTLTGMIAGVTFGRVVRRRVQG